MYIFLKYKFSLSLNNKLNLIFFKKYPLKFEFKCTKVVVKLQLSVLEKTYVSHCTRKRDVHGFSLRGAQTSFPPYKLKLYTFFQFGVGGCYFMPLPLGTPCV